LPKDLWDFGKQKIAEGTVVTNKWVPNTGFSLPTRKTDGGGVQSAWTGRPIPTKSDRCL